MGVSYNQYMYKLIYTDFKLLKLQVYMNLVYIHSYKEVTFIEEFTLILVI